MILTWCAVSLIQTVIAVTYSVYKQKRKIHAQELFLLISGSFLLFLCSPIAGVIASFLVLDKMRARQIEKRDLACTDEGRAIRSMLKASQIRMEKRVYD